MKKFRTIDFGIGCLFDYPQDVPLPRIGEKVFFNDLGGTVEEVKHRLTDAVHEIRILVNIEK